MGETAGMHAGQQRITALNHANRVRIERAKLKRLIAAGELAAAEVLYTCPWGVANMPADELLRSQNRWGDQRCRRLLQRLGIPENKTVGTLTDRQRTALVAELARQDGARTALSPAPEPRRAPWPSV